MPRDAVRAAARPAKLNVKKIERSRLAEEAANQLRRLILLGELPPGRAVRERDMADLLGVSRTPLREAVQHLAVEGLIEYSPTRRPYVANPTIEDIRQGMLVMAALEALGGEQACLHAADKEIQRVGELHERMLETSDSGKPLEFFETDMAFHRAIIEASHNSVLEETHNKMNARLWRTRFLSSRLHTRRDRTLAQHEEIYTSLKDRNAKRAARAMRVHLETGIKNIRESLEKEAEDNNGSAPA